MLGWQPSSHQRIIPLTTTIRNFPQTHCSLNHFVTHVSARASLVASTVAACIAVTSPRQSSSALALATPYLDESTYRSLSKACRCDSQTLSTEISRTAVERRRNMEVRTQVQTEGQPPRRSQCSVTQAFFGAVRILQSSKLHMFRGPLLSARWLPTPSNTDCKYSRIVVRRSGVLSWNHRAIIVYLSRISFFSGSSALTRLNPCQIIASRTFTIVDDQTLLVSLMVHF